VLIRANAAILPKTKTVILKKLKLAIKLFFLAAFVALVACAFAFKWPRAIYRTYLHTVSLPKLIAMGSGDNTDAQMVLANRYHFGRNAPADESEAAKWLHRAAE